VDESRRAWLDACANTLDALARRRLVRDDFSAARLDQAWKREERAFEAYEVSRFALHAVASDRFARSLFAALGARAFDECVSTGVAVIASLAGEA
jgi:hypothetical protein